ASNLLHPYATGTGTRTQKTPALDLDVKDPEVIARLKSEVAEWFAGHKLIFRTGEAPKVAVLFRCDATFPKIVRVFKAPDGTEHRIEFLCDGQQLACYGVHPKTRLPYSWEGGVGPINVPWAELPLIDVQSAKALVDCLAAMLKEQFGYIEAA